MMKFKRKTTVSVQFEDNQINWLETQASLRSQKECRRVSISEINREVLQKAIDEEKQKSEQ